MPARKLNIIMVAAEVAPFVKVGGLADVLGGLPRALKALGHDVRIVMPYYPMVRNAGQWELEEILGPCPIPIREAVTEYARVHRTEMPPSQPGENDGLPVYMIESDRWFVDADRSERVYSGDPDPYIFLCRAVMELVPLLERGWSPDILHCHDWQAGLAPVYLRTLYHCKPGWQNASAVTSVHNLAHSGSFGPDVLAKAGLPEYLYTYDKLEFYGQVSLMKGGLVYSDQINTVSETYAREIQTAEYGCGFEGLFRYLAGQGRLSGIVNGIDTATFDPATDPHVTANYDRANIAGKAACKAALQQECGFAVDPHIPVAGIVTRLVEQKGLDLMKECADRLFALPFQLVVLGVGSPEYEKFFQQMAKKHPGKVYNRNVFDAPFAQRIYSGSDLFLMPSRFEPCGLGQLIALRYGTIPIVRKTGGLADTVEDFAPSARGRGRGNGFVFGEYRASEMLSTVGRALDAFQDKPRWSALIDRGMSADFGWARPAKEYVSLYRRAVSGAALESAA